MEFYKNPESSESTISKDELPLIKEIASFLCVQKIKKKEYVLRAGEINNSVIYVKKGLLRVFLLNEGKEVNTWFVKDDDFFISMNSYFQNIPSHENIQAIEDTEIITISKTKYEMLIKKNHKLALFAIKELNIKLCEYQDQCLALRFMNAEKKYSFLKKNKPEFILDISQKHLASYLGIETTYLSRIISNYKE
jgi:CRP-like cAMP-binding protein